jgi:hypothetical protein
MDVGTGEPMQVDSHSVSLRGLSCSEIHPAWEESGNHAAKECEPPESIYNHARRDTPGQVNSSNAGSTLLRTPADK